MNAPEVKVDYAEADNLAEEFAEWTNRIGDLARAYKSVRERERLMRATIDIAIARLKAL